MFQHLFVCSLSFRRATEIEYIYVHCWVFIVVLRRRLSGRAWCRRRRAGSRRRVVSGLCPRGGLAGRRDLRDLLLWEQSLPRCDRVLWFVERLVLVVPLLHPRRHYSGWMRPDGAHASHVAWRVGRVTWWLGGFAGKYLSYIPDSENYPGRVKLQSEDAVRPKKMDCETSGGWKLHFRGSERASCCPAKLSSSPDCRSRSVVLNKRGCFDGEFGMPSPDNTLC